SKLTNRVHRQRRGRGNGLVEMPNDLLEHLLVVEAAEHHLLVRGAEQSSRPPCFLELVDVLPRAEPYREGPHWMVGESAHDRDNHARVDPAAEQGTDRYVAHHLAPDRRLQALLEQGDPFLLGPVAGVARDPA